MEFTEAMKEQGRKCKAMMDESLKAVRKRYGVLIPPPKRKTDIHHRTCGRLWLPSKKDWHEMCEAAGVEETEEGRNEWIRRELETVWTAAAALPEVGMSMQYEFSHDYEAIIINITFTPVTEVFAKENCPHNSYWILWLLFDPKRLFVGSDKMREAAYKCASLQGFLWEKMLKEEKNPTPESIERRRMMDDFYEAM